MPRKKNSSKNKKTDGRSTSTASSSSSSAVPAASAENIPENEEALVEVAAKVEQAPAEVNEVDQGEPQKAEKKPKSSKKKKKESGAEPVAAAHANVMLELTEALSTNMKPKFDEVGIKSAETTYAQLMTETRTSQVLGTVARTEKAGSSDVTAIGMAPVSTDVDSQSSCIDLGEKKSKSKKVNGQLPDVSLEIFRSQQKEVQKMMDLRSALSAELNFRLGIAKGLKPVNAASGTPKAGKEKKPSVAQQKPSSGGKKITFAPNTNGGSDDGGKRIPEPPARGPLGGESLASLIGKRREELQRKKEEMGVTSPSKEELTSLKKENAALKERVVNLEAVLNKLSERVEALEIGGGSAAAPAAVKKPVAKKEEAKDDDDDDVDLFGSDDEEEDAAAAKVREDRLAAYAAKKSKKPTLIAKSSILLDVKPWDDETDMKKMEEEVRKIELDGLLWGASKLVPLAYGIQKLTINCVIEDDKVSTDWLQEEIEKIEDYVQSTDIAAFNKI